MLDRAAGDDLDDRVEATTLALDAAARLTKNGAHRAARILMKAGVPASLTSDSDVLAMLGAWSQSMTSALRAPWPRWRASLAAA